MGRIRRLAAPLTGAGTGAALAFSGLPPELVGIIAGAAGQTAGELIFEKRSREAVVAATEQTAPTPTSDSAERSRACGIAPDC